MLAVGSASPGIAVTITAHAPGAMLGVLWLSWAAWQCWSRWPRRLVMRREAERATRMLRALATSGSVPLPLLAYALGTPSLDRWLTCGVPPAEVENVAAVVRLAEVAARTWSATAMNLVMIAYARVREESAEQRHTTLRGVHASLAAAGRRGRRRYRVTMRGDEPPKRSRER